MIGRFVFLLLFLVSLILFMTGCNQANDEPTATSDVQIEMTVEPAPPAAGEAILVITLRSGEGDPIDGATVSARGDMDHAGMTPVEGETDTSVTGIYHVPFTWTMGGGWIVEITAQLPNGEITSETFNLFVEAMANQSVLHQPSNTEESDN